VAYDPNNIFAKILRGEVPSQKVYEDDATIAILDVMPQSDGHTLVIPKAPAENLFELDAASLEAVIRTGQRMALAVRRAFHPDGITLLQFNGAEAGQTVFHFHLHVVPRYAGQPLRSHGRGFADPAVLAGQAAQLRTALGGSPRGQGETCPGRGHAQQNLEGNRGEGRRRLSGPEKHQRFQREGRERGVAAQQPRDQQQARFRTRQRPGFRETGQQPDQQGSGDIDHQRAGREGGQRPCRGSERPLGEAAYQVAQDGTHGAPRGHEQEIPEVQGANSRVRGGMPAARASRLCFSLRMLRTALRNRLRSSWPSSGAAATPMVTARRRMA